MFTPSFLARGARARSGAALLVLAAVACDTNPTALAPTAAATNLGGVGMVLDLPTVALALGAAIASAQIVADPVFRFPIWSDVIQLHFLAGDLRTWPSEWLGWSPWAGFAAWAAVALPLGGVLVARVSRA